MSHLPGSSDPIWHVSSRSGEASCELLYSVYLYLYLYYDYCYTRLWCLGMQWHQLDHMQVWKQTI